MVSHGFGCQLFMIAAKAVGVNKYSRGCNFVQTASGAPATSCDNNAPSTKGLGDIIHVFTDGSATHPTEAWT